MKSFVLTALFSMFLIGQAKAYEIRGGIQNVQVRDISFKDFDDSFDELFDTKWWRFFNLAHVQFAGEITTGVDLIGGLRLGTESV
jgi:hypothetical protein